MCSSDLHTHAAQALPRTGIAEHRVALHVLDDHPLPGGECRTTGTLSLPVDIPEIDPPVREIALRDDAQMAPRIEQLERTQRSLVEGDHRREDAIEELLQGRRPRDRLDARERIQHIESGAGESVSHGLNPSSHVPIRRP